MLSDFNKRIDIEHISKKISLIVNSKEISFEFKGEIKDNRE